MSKARDIVETLRTVLVDGDVTNANFTGADLEISKGGTGASSTGAARTALGVAIGTDVLAPDGDGSALTGVDSLPSQTSQSGKFLTTNGSAASWGTVAPAGLVLLSTVNASNAATVTIDTLFTSTYSKYLIEVTDLRPLTANVSIQLEREINSSYAQYTYVREETLSGVWSNRTPNITQPLNNSPSQRGASFTMTIYDPANALTVNTGHIFGVCQSGYAGGTPSLINNWLLNTNAYALTGLRFKASSGNISGVFKIYGVSI